ncbi:MAG: flagellar filament capping protein FliD [Proteobacteria bacterium]|uniref:flagellar filament capping protein FliD n=1 Tax=Aquabacterium sp. TaxID=1872578 RepID=UPI0035C6D5CC|nr:flagellar filament capping protein FliD [Pseudomonadota bacterium]
MASLSSLGVGSGLDAETIVTKLVALEKQPADALTTTNTKLQTQVSTWGKIQSNFSSLQDAASKLQDSSFWSSTTAKSSDDTTVSVTTGSNAAAGSYAVAVSQLAAGQSVASSAYTASTAKVGEGTLTIQLGTYTTDNSTTPPAVTFAAKAAASAVNITIGPDDNTLEKIRDRINTANAGVSASIVTDASGARLVLRGQNGETNAFKVSVTESAAAPGLSALAYTAETGGTSAMIRTQSAQNAKATINGLDISSESNTLNNVVDGVTLKLNKTNTSPTTVTVDQDTAGITKGMQDFITAYNSVVSTIRVQTMYDEASKTAGPLQGNATARGLLAQMRGLIGSSTSASNVFSRLSDVGIDINKDGTLSMKSTKFNDAMSKNMADLKKFFGNSSDTDSTLNGVGTRVKNLTKQILDATSGAIANSTNGLNSTITRNKNKIEDINEHATKVETRLRAQYTALDTSMAKLSGLSTYMTAQLAALNK